MSFWAIAQALTRDFARLALASDLQIVVVFGRCVALPRLGHGAAPTVVSGFRRDIACLHTLPALLLRTALRGLHHALPRLATQTAASATDTLATFWPRARQRKS